MRARRGTVTAVVVGSLVAAALVLSTSAADARRAPNGGMPEAAVDPAAAAVGETILIEGRHFQPAEEVMVEFGGVVVATPTADAAGSFNVSGTVPPIPVGFHPMSFNGSLGTSVSLDYEVLPAPTPPTTAPPTTAPPPAADPGGTDGGGTPGGTTDGGTPGGTTEEATATTTEPEPEETTTTAADDENGDDDDGGFPWLWLVVALVVATAGTGLVILAVRRRRKEDEDESDEEESEPEGTE